MPDRPKSHRCDNCDERWHESELRVIHDYHERVEAGGAVPSGECPSCHCLCFPEETPSPVRWQPASTPPDCDTTVLVHLPKADDPVWFGYFDSERWRLIDAEIAPGEVTHWAHLPDPPA